MKTIAVVMLCACSAPHDAPNTIDGPSNTGSGDSATTGDGPPAKGCAGKTAQPTDSTWTLMVGSLSRTANVHVPASYDPTKAIPVVIDLHGRLGNATDEP